MGWQDDLQSLLGNTKDEMWNGLQTSDSTPFNEIAAGDWGGAVTSVPSAAFNFMDLPLSSVKDIVGYGLAAPDLIRDATGHGDAGTRATLARLNSSDNGGMGGRNEWEHFINDDNAVKNFGIGGIQPVKMALELGMDPTTYLSMGLAPAVSGLVKGAKAAEGVTELGRGAKAGLAALDTADFLWNTGPDKIVREALIPGGKKVAGVIPGVKPAVVGSKYLLHKAVDNPFGLTAASRARRGFQQIESAIDEKLQAMGVGLPNKALAIIPDRHNDTAIAPFETYDVPPFFQKGTTGLSSQVQSMAFDSWSRLKQQSMSQPSIPGVNTPGMGENAPWRNSLRRAASVLEQGGQSYSQGMPAEVGNKYGVSNLRQAVEDWSARQQTMGFIQPPAGGYKTIHDVQLDEDNIRDMARIGAAAMWAYNDTAKERLFPALRRSSEGMQRANKAVTDVYGQGVTPYLPASWDEARKILAEKGLDAPSSRFTLPWGFPEGKVDSTRLDAIESRWKSGKITEQQAIQEAVGNKFAKGTPQLVETASGMGAAPLMSFQRQMSPEEARGTFDAFGGTLRPTATDDITKRAVVPPGFEEHLDANAQLNDTYLGTFDSNKELYDSYMQSLFGQMSPQELEVLRQSSIESAYDEMVSAASQVSGGTAGATTFLKKGPEKPVPKTRHAKDEAGNKLYNPDGSKQMEDYIGGNYAGDSHQKVGIFGEGPNDIGYTEPGGRKRYEEVPEGTTMMPTGRVSFKSANQRAFVEANNGQDLTAGLYRQLVGDPSAKFSGTSDQYLTALNAMGHEGFRENPVGGAVANIYKIVDMYKAGRRIPVGATVSEKWYHDAAKEALDIAGPGNYEDAMMLIELMAITSSGTDVEKNAKNALRGFAEWKFGSDEYIRTQMGLTEDQIKQLLNGTITAGKRKGKGGWTDHLNMFRNQMQYSQKDTTTKAFEIYANKLDQEGWTPVQGGPKTNNFAGSFVFKLWQDAVDKTIPDGPLRERVQRSLDDAATIWTEDRHQSRISNLATAVSPMGAVVNRERGIMASKLVPVRGEDMQASIWYYSKDRQGFQRVARNDDMAIGLREAWNNEADPSRLAVVRDEARKTIGPDAAEEEIQKFAYDTMYQEVQLAMIQKALGGNKKAVNKVLGQGNPLQKLWESQQDDLGIVSRGARGVATRTSPANSIIDMTNQVEQHLMDLRNGSYGTTLEWDGNTFKPFEAQDGYAVALTSAGRALDTGKPKTGAKAVNQFLLKYADLLDDPTTGGHIKFGFFPMDGNKAASFDLTLIVPDEQTAVDLARRANQKAIWDVKAGAEIATGGDGTPVITSAKDVRDVIYSVFGKADNSHITSANNAASIDEFTNDPGSIFQRRVVTPVMEQFQHLSERAARGNEQLANAAKLQTPGGGVLAPGGVSDTAPMDFAGMGQNGLISTQGNKILGEDLNGSRVNDLTEKYYQEAQADIQHLVKSGVSWDAGADLKARLEIVRDRPDLKAIVEKYGKEGFDPLFTTPRDVTLHRIERDVQKKEGVKFEKDSLWDLFVSAWGEQALFSPKYHLGNLQGAFLQNAFSGHMGADSPSAFLAAWKITRGGLENVDKQEALRQLKSYQIANKWGFEELPSYISRGGVRAMTSDTRASGSAVGELTARLTKSSRLGSAVGKPFEWNADLSQALETVIRGSLWADFLDDEMTRRMSTVEDSINQMAVQQGLDGFEFSMLNNINLPSTGDRLVITPKVLKDHLMQMGFTDGYAERAARNYAEHRNIAKGIAKGAVDKYQFSYDRTNLDEAIGKFAPFMYWQTRAVKFYGEELIRHPAIALNYARANRGVEDAQNDPGLTARQKGFLRVMGGPTGFSILLNPEALFGVVKMFGLDDNYTPDGQTETGGVISWLKARGLGMYPWIDGSLNLMGVYGDTFEPDMLGIRHKALVGSVVNFMRSHLGMEPMGSPYQDAMGQARWGVSSFISQFTPDWMTQPVMPKAGGNTGDATFDQIIESRIIDANPGLSNQQLLDIMTDENSPEFKTAYQQASDANLLQNLMNFTAPQNYRVREDSRDRRQAQVSTIYEAAQASGQDAWNFRPTAGDVEFATTYERLTGNKWKPTDYVKSKEKNDLMRATPEHKTYVLQEQEYGKLGGDRNQEILSRYRDIMYGNDPRTAAMDPDSRREIANQWADANGYADNIDYVYRIQTAYEQTHPEYGQFKGWQDQMNSLKTSMGGSLDEYRRQAIRQNPNAANYFTRMIAGIKEDYPQEEWSAEIDRQTTNMNAYLSITGVPQNRFDPGPSPMTPPGDMTLATSTPPQAYGNIPDAMYRIMQGDSGYGLNTYGTYWNR